MFIAKIVYRVLDRDGLEIIRLIIALLLNTSLCIARLILIQPIPFYMQGARENGYYFLPGKMT